MVRPLLSLMLLLQGTAVPPTTSVSVSPPRLKEAVRDFTRSILQPKVSGPISVDLNHGSRASYQTLGDLAGLNIIFDRDFRDSSFKPVHVDNSDIVEAIDHLSELTGNFVEVIGSKAMVVAPNTSAKRRQYELQVMKTIYLTYASSPQEISGVITMLRKTLQLRFLAMSPDAKGVVIRDSPDRIAAAEKLAAELDNTSSSPAIAIDSAGNLLIPNSSGVRKTSRRRSEIQAATTRPISIDTNDDVRRTYETLAAMAGLDVDL